MLGDDDEQHQQQEGKLGYSSSDLAAVSASSQQESHQQTQSRPIMSKTAEAELYLLATNFLLYVAMVIITVIVAKIYFPESLERSNAHQTPTARSFSYRMVSSSSRRRRGSSGGGVDENSCGEPRNGQDDDIYFYDEDDDENQEHDELYDDEDVLDSDDEEAEDRARSQGGEGTSSRGGGGRRSAVHILDFQQSSLSKLQVIRRLTFCSLMLNVTFVCWGLLQERMLTRRYPRFTGEYFTYSYALVFTNRFWTLIMSGLLMLRLRPRPSQTTVIYEYSFPSISNMLSSWCQYEALRYVSFPATTLFKSFKLAPVMAMGKILGNKVRTSFFCFLFFALVLRCCQHYFPSLILCFLCLL
jgi:hypothetical protein